MTIIATYDELLGSDKDRARVLIGDTETADALLSDAHISAVLLIEGTLKAGVIALCTELIARFAREPVRKSAKGISVDYSDRLKEWRRIVADASLSASGGALSFVRANYTGEQATDEFARPPNYWP